MVDVEEGILDVTWWGSPNEGETDATDDDSAWKLGIIVSIELSLIWLETVVVLEVVVDDGKDIEKEVRFPFHPTRGGKQIKKDRSQTAAMTIFARRPVIMDRYLTGRVTARYLSTEMAHKFRMDAVHIQTSTTSHPWHQISPKIQTSNTCGFNSHHVGIWRIDISLTKDQKEWRNEMKGHDAIRNDASIFFLVNWIFR